MPLVVTAEREAPSVRYKKVGRFHLGDNAVIEVIRDRYGGIRSIPTGDIILALNGLPIDGVSVSESGRCLSSLELMEESIWHW